MTATSHTRQEIHLPRSNVNDWTRWSRCWPRRFKIPGWSWYSFWRWQFDYVIVLIKGRGWRWWSCI